MAGGRGLDRILTEARAGKYLADLYYDGPREAYVFYAKEKLAAKNLTPLRNEIYDFQKDKEGYWVSLSLTLNTFAYNTELVSATEAPKTWEDLLDPKWKGRIAMDTEPDVMIEGLISAWGREKTEDYLKRLSRQNIVMRRGHTLIAQLLAAGDFPVAAELYDYRVLELKHRGAPVELVLTSPMPAATNALMIPRHAPRPHAAALMYDFLVSEEGQKIISIDIGRTPSRRGVPALYKELDKVAERYQVSVNHPDLVGPHGELVSKLIDDIFLRQRFLSKELGEKLKKYEKKEK
jgi:iron(III) transport system substrate-binding protein